MNKEEIQKEIIEFENRLKQLRNKLEEPKRYAGLVYKSGSGSLILCPSEGNGIGLEHFQQCFNGVDDSYNHYETFLGHFKDVFIQRSEIDKEYVSKADLREFLRGNHDEYGWSVRVDLSRKFNINY